MPPSEIIALLVEHQCLDITDQLDLERCGNVPMARGGFGDIYGGKLSGGTSVAIKCSRLCFNRGDPEGQKVLKSAARELYVWSRLKHDNVLELLGLAQFQNQIAMVSPWMDNGNLRQYLKRNPNADRYQLCVGISEGVAYLHQKNTIHGDIKSGNVLVSSEGVAKLADFGCTELKDFSTLNFSTTSDSSKYSTRWAAPEILEGFEKSTGADVYALGMTLLEILTGKIPFSDKQDDVSVIYAVCARQTHERPKEFPSFSSDEAELLWSILLGCWAYEPADRPDSTSVMVQLRGVRLSGAQGLWDAYLKPQPYQENINAQSKFSNLHALIVGVDKYEHPEHHNLAGCLPDAKAIFNYLTETLQVPQDHIVCLLDEQATRKGILAAFWKHLILNEDIQHSDPILVYFSGHGDQLEAPADWYTRDGYLELILPHDANPWDSSPPNPEPSSSESGSNTPGVNPNHGGYDPNRHHKHGIPDKTLGALVQRLSQAKGDNITVILDSCHSGGGTAGHDQETHVLLAACTRGGGAAEIPSTNPAVATSMGLFTKALLITLKECDIGTTSYSALMWGVQKHMKAIMSGVNYRYKVQRPPCEGRKQDRLLFRTQFALTKGMIQLDRDSQHNALRIEAGSASGIQLGTELGVYAGNMQRTSPPIARLVAVQVNATTSTLRIQDADSNVEIPENAYVLVTKYTGHSVRILADDQLKVLPLWQDVFSKLQSQPIDIVWSKPDESSDLVLVSSERGIIIQRQDPLVVRLRPRDIVLRQQLSSSELERTLSAVAHFHFHLQRRNPESPLRGLVGMKLIELKTKPGRVWRVKEYIPISESPDDLFGNSLSNGTVVELQATPDKRYGLQLTNSSNWPLFAWVLCFNLYDYSVNFVYNPARNTDPSLSTNGRAFGVGYGNTGVEPLRIHTSGYSDRECGVLMLFVSNRWTDISHMEQSAIFEPMGNASVRSKEEGSHREPPSLSEPAGDAGVRSNGGTSRSLGPIVWDILVVGVSINQ